MESKRPLRPSALALVQPRTRDCRGSWFRLTSPPEESREDVGGPDDVIMRGPHDVGGLEEGPIDPQAHALTFWEKQIDGLRAAVGARGLLSSHENRRAVESLGDQAYATLDYYERWTAALCRQMVDKGILTQDEIDAKVSEIRRRLAESGELETIKPEAAT